jgi:hypothetical protein
MGILDTVEKLNKNPLQPENQPRKNCVVDQSEVNAILDKMDSSRENRIKYRERFMRYRVDHTDRIEDGEY